MTSLSQCINKFRKHVLRLLFCSVFLLIFILGFSPITNGEETTPHFSDKVILLVDNQELSFLNFMEMSPNGDYVFGHAAIYPNREARNVRWLQSLYEVDYDTQQVFWDLSNIDLRSGLTIMKPTTTLDLGMTEFDVTIAFEPNSDVVAVRSEVKGIRILTLPDLQEKLFLPFAPGESQKVINPFIGARGTPANIVWSPDGDLLTFLVNADWHILNLDTQHASTFNLDFLPPSLHPLNASILPIDQGWMLVNSDVPIGTFVVCDLILTACRQNDIGSKYIRSVSRDGDLMFATSYDPPPEVFIPYLLERSADNIYTSRQILAHDIVENCGFPGEMSPNGRYVTVICSNEANNLPLVALDETLSLVQDMRVYDLAQGIMLPHELPQGEWLPNSRHILITPQEHFEYLALADINTGEIVDVINLSMIDGLENLGGYLRPDEPLDKIQPTVSIDGKRILYHLGWAALVISIES